MFQHRYGTNSGFNGSTLQNIVTSTLAPNTTDLFPGDAGELSR